MSSLLHAANILYFLSYSVRDILWLRVLTIAGLLMCMPYFLLRDQPDWPPFGWHAVFVIVNTIQVAVLIRERMPIQLTPDETALYNGPLRNMTPQQVRRVARHGAWSDCEVGAELVAEGEDLHRLILLHTGQAAVRSQGKTIATLSGGQFIGEMSLLTGSGASAQVIATEPVRTLTWSEEWVERANNDSDLQLAIQAALGVDLVHKLHRMRDHAWQPNVGQRSNNLA